MVSVTEDRRHGPYVTSPRPRDVPGYDEAKASGAVPRVPVTPPAIAVRPTARRALRDTALVGVAAVIALLSVLFIGASDGALPWPAVGTLLVVGAVCALALRTAVRRWGRAQIAELQRGYTTTTFSTGRFWAGVAAPDGPWTRGRIAWTWDATWVMRPDGTVISEPSGDTEPPGLYPSPRHEGRLELWTGYQWSGYLPDTTDQV